MGELLDIRPVVGKEDQPFALLVEPPGGEEPHRRIGPDEIDRLLFRVRVMVGADVAARFMEHDVEADFRRADRCAVQRDLVAGSDARARFQDGTAVDGDPAGLDQFARGAAGGRTGGAEKFNQAFAVVVFQDGCLAVSFA